MVYQSVNRQKMKWMKSGFLFIMCSIYQPPNIKPYPPQPPLLMSVFSPTAQNNLLCSLVGWIEQLITQNLTDLFDLFNNVLMLCFSRKLANADQSSYTHTHAPVLKQKHLLMSSSPIITSVRCRSCQ